MKREEERGRGRRGEAGGEGGESCRASFRSERSESFLCDSIESEGFEVVTVGGVRRKERGGVVSEKE